MNLRFLTIAFQIKKFIYNSTTILGELRSFYYYSLQETGIRKFTYEITQVA